MWCLFFFSRLLFSFGVWFRFCFHPHFHHLNPQLLIIHTASELSWCVFLRLLELSVRVEPLFNCVDGCFVKPFWWHSGRCNCDFKSLSYEKMWFKLSTGSQIRISSWLGIFVRGHWNFLTVCYTHRCLDCGKKRGKELFTVSPTKNFDTPLSSVFFFLTSSYVIRQQWCQLRIDELCAMLGEHIYIRNSATKLSEKERQTQRTHCRIHKNTRRETERRRESNAVFAFTERTLLLQQFFCVFCSSFGWF